ncbi:MAG: 2'-5' RNA ligase [Pirellulaceae bacterium]|jgi:2'-5' RNA ligase
MNSIRTFIAIQLSREVTLRGAKLIDKLKRSEAAVRWVATEDMHITLKFLGEVPSVETIHVCRQIAAATANHKRFDIEVVGAGAFPDIDRARSVWAGIEQGKEQLEQLFISVDDALHEIGFPCEARRYHPHVTLGRVRRSGPTQEKLSEILHNHAEFHCGFSTVEEVVVLSSTSEKGGPIYDIMGRGKLA